MNKTVQQYKDEVTKKGSDAVTIILRKYGFFFNTKMTDALIEAYQQGAMAGFQMAQEIVNETKENLTKDPYMPKIEEEDLPF